MPPTIDWPPPRPPRRRFGGLVATLVILFALSAGAALSYYVDALWFDSLGFSDVFWTRLNAQGVVFAAVTILSFVSLYGAFLALKPANLEQLAGGTILINGQPLRLPVEPVLRVGVIVVALAIAVAAGFGMMAQWNTLALYWHSGSSAVEQATTATDPIFQRPIAFYFFTLPAWRLIASWLTTLAFVILAAAVFFTLISSSARLVSRRIPRDSVPLSRVFLTFGIVLIAMAAQIYLGRFDRLFAEHAIFSGVTYTDAHVTIMGRSIVAAALVLGAIAAWVSAFMSPSVTWLAAAVGPAVAAYVITGLIGWYVSSFIVKPNELVREGPFIAHNIALTRQAYALDRIAHVEFPAEAGVAAMNASENGATLENIRLWDWRALQDTLRQIQEIRTYYDFPDIDIDRYEIDGVVRQVMLAVRELNIDRLPESSRNWINEKLIYTHGYGITMNPVNGFTSEGLPSLILSNMPVQSTVPALMVTRPEIYFGELTNADVYVRTRQKEFNFPQGEANNVTSYEGNAGIRLGGYLRRALIALDRGDIARLPFSDDVNADSRLLMRRNIRERVETIAPFLTYDSDPYIVIADGGRLFWMIDAFTTATTYPYSRSTQIGPTRLNYLRNSVKVVVNAYDGAVNFYVFDTTDPIIAAYRELFPTLFKDASAMPPALRKHVRYPELLLEIQAAVYGLYHMTNPEVFYNREDLWSVASEVGMTARREQATQTMEPNFVLMKLPGEKTNEFVEVLPFTPARRNNLIGWIAGRSDDPHYGSAIVYNFPKTRLVDGPLQIEARIDQNAQLSGQLSLWNQQGSSVRRGSLIVIPIGRALLYAEPIYLQAEHSPMPELRIVVLALQDRLAYGPNFETALSALLGQSQSTLTLPTSTAPAPSSAPSGPLRPSPAPAPSADVETLIAEAARDLADYQRLTAEGRLGEAGQRLEALKQKLEELTRRSR